MYRGRGGYNNRGRGRGWIRGRGRGFGRGTPFFGRSPPRRKRSSPDRVHTRENQYCMFCKVQLNTTAAYDEHNATVVHKQKEGLVRKALADGLHYCYTCEKIFPTKLELDAHCLMTRHQPLYRMEEITEQLEKKKSPSPESPPAQSESQMRRTKDDKDRQKIVMKLNDMREDNNKKDKSRKPFFCDVCSVDCLNESNFKIHQESWRHRAEVDRRKEEELQQLKFEEEADKAFEEAEEAEKNINVLNPTETVTFHCEVCSVPMNDQVAYLQHLRGRKHLRQISMMKRPFKCYICSMSFTVEKEFNHHLESNAHIDKAYRNKLIVKDGDKRPDVSKEKRRDDKRDDRERRDGHRDRREVVDKEHGGGSSTNRDKHTVNNNPARKVELIRSPSEGDVDLREKLGGKTNIVITKTNSTTVPERKDSLYGPKLPALDVNSKKDNADRRAKELEFAAKFRKLAKEYSNDLPALKEKLTREREQDIATYQQFETTYSSLCREEDFVRENIRVLDEKDPRKEEYIRDMIRIQNDMREVRQELEVREMMIIKRESLFREKFPHDTNKKVVINLEQSKNSADNNKSNDDAPASQSGKTDLRSSTNQVEGREPTSSDLRIQLERERLLKRLGSELNGIDPSLREKLMAVILNNNDTGDDKKAPATKDISTEKKKQMQMLTEREKQLQLELAALKSNTTAAQKKKITKSLVPQYDDVEEKKDGKKRSSRRRMRSRSTDSSASSSSSSSNDGGSKRKDRKRRRHSPSDRTDRSRKKRSHRRSSSRDRDRDRDRKKKSSSSRRRDDDRKRKSDRNSKKPVKITIKSKEESKLSKSSNPLPGDDSESDNDIQITEDSSAPQQQTIQVIGGPSTSQSISLYQPPPPPQQLLQQQQQHLNVHIPPTVIPPQRREQFSFWKNPAVVATPAPAAKVSPKDDVWDIAFSGSKQDTEPEKYDDLTQLFNTNVDSPKALSAEILNILKSVAPNIQHAVQQSSQHHQQQQQPVATSQRQPEILAPLRSHNFPQDMARQFPIPVPESEKQVPKAFPSYGKPESFQAVTTTTPETSGGRIRSILKKMKDPPPIATSQPQTTTTITSTSTTSSSFVIPGLDGPVDTKTTPGVSLPEKQPMNSSHLISYGSTIDERALYGSAAAAVAASAVDTLTPLSYKEDTQRSSYPPASNYDSYAAASRIYEERSEPLAYSRQTDPYDTRLPPRRDDVNRVALDRLPPRDYLDHLGRRLPGREQLPPARDALSPARDNPLTDREPVSRHAPSYERDIEAYRRIEQTRRDDRLPPPRIDPYGRDTLPFRERSLPPPPRSLDARGEDPLLQTPVRRIEESENEFYLRFERFYEVKRRREAELALRSLPPRRADDEVRRLPPPPGEFGGRPPYNDRRRDDRYDERVYRRPPDDHGRLPPHEFDRYRGRDLRDLPPHPGPDASRDRRSVGESERRLDDLPPQPRRGEEGRRMVDDRRTSDGLYGKDMPRGNNVKPPLNLLDANRTLLIKDEKHQSVDEKSSDRLPAPINRGIPPGLDLKTTQRDGERSDMNRRPDVRAPLPPRRYDRFNPY